ncbi:hypothetical protein AB1E18_010850 [Capra hircus]
MSWQRCARLALGSLVLGFILATQLTVPIFRLPFCGSKEIGVFYCDVLPVMRLACADTRVHKATLFVVSVAVLALPFLLITLSYVFIAAAILKIRSAEGRRKAFATCSSHMTMVLLQYGGASLIYLCPSSSYSPERGQVNAGLPALCQQLLRGPRAALPAWKSHLVTGKLNYSDKGPFQTSNVESCSRVRVLRRLESVELRHHR